MKAKDSRLVRGFQRSMHAPNAAKRVPVMRNALLAMQQQAAAASTAGGLAPRSCEARATISKIMHQLLTITEHAAPSEMHSDATGAPCVTAVVTEARKGSPGQVMTAPVTGPTRSFRQLEQRIKQASTKLAYVARRAGPGMDANAEQHVRDVWVEVCQILPTIVDGINKAQAEAHTTYQQWTQDQAAARAAKVPADKRALVAQHDCGLLAIRQEMQEEVEAGSARVAPAHVRKLAHVAIPSANQHSTDGDWRQFRMELAQRAPDTLAWLRAQRDRMNSKCNEISHKHQTHMLRMNDMQGVVQATRASSKPTAPPPARYTRLVGGNPANSSEQYVECTRKATGASMQTQGTPLPFAKRQTVAGVTTYEYAPPAYCPSPPDVHIQVDPRVADDEANAAQHTTDAADPDGAVARECAVLEKLKTNAELQAQIKLGDDMLAEAMQPKQDLAGMQWPFKFTQDEHGQPLFSHPEVLEDLRVSLRGTPAAARYGGFHMHVLARAHCPDHIQTHDKDPPPNWAMDVFVDLVAVALAYRTLPDAARVITRIPIAKPDGGERPISITHAVYSIISGIVAKVMTAAAETSGALPDSVQSYRPGRGTWKCLYPHRAAMERAANGADPLYILSDDWEKFYDSVPLDVIILCLRAGGCPVDGYAEWAAEVMHERPIQVATSEGLTKEVMHDCGFLQGSAFSCVAVNFVVAMLHRLWDANIKGIQLR